jgi:hypothetical protein
MVLGTFAKFQKATIYFRHVCRSFSPSVRPHRTTGRIFMKFNIWDFFRKSVENIQVSLKCDNNKGTLRQVLCTFMIIYHWILLRMRNVSEKIVQKFKTIFLFSYTFFVHLHIFCSVTHFLFSYTFFVQIHIFCSDIHFCSVTHFLFRYTFFVQLHIFCSVTHFLFRYTFFVQIHIFCSDTHFWKSCRF